MARGVCILKRGREKKEIHWSVSQSTARRRVTKKKNPTVTVSRVPRREGVPRLRSSLFLLLAVKGARPRLRAEQTASSFPPAPAGRRVLCSPVRERDPDTDQRAAAFPQPGRKRREEEERSGGDEKGGWRQRRQSIPPTGCTRRYRLEHTVPSNKHLTNWADFISEPVELNEPLSVENFFKHLCILRRKVFCVSLICCLETNK